jgi:hypothetical protein
MKRTLIATLVGAIIIFIYQGLSWEALPIHKNSFKYTPAQDSIMSALSGQLKEDGMYFMPLYPPGTAHEDAENMMKANIGKPWAMVSYHAVLDFDMVGDMLTGVLLNLLAVWIIVYILTKAAGVFSTFNSRLWLTILIYMVVALQSTLMEWNWLHSPSHYICPAIIDELISALLLGLWLGWYLGRKPKTVS